MTAALQHLVAEARAAADPAPPWVVEGGRSCPIGWEDCSQPVFRLAGTEHYDYGERGGPGDTHCRSACPHGLEPPPIYCTECGGTEPCGVSGPCGPYGWLAKSLGVPALPVEPCARPVPGLPGEALGSSNGPG